MKLASALLLSAGAHLTALSVAGMPGGPASGSAPAAEPRLRASLVLRSSEAEAAPAKKTEGAARRDKPRPQAEASAAQSYLRMAELDVRPQIRTHVMPQYPENVLPGTRGRVVLELLVQADGKVAAVNVARAEPGGVFEEAAVKAFSDALFSPGMKRGAPVPALLRVEVVFGD